MLIICFGTFFALVCVHACVCLYVSMYLCVFSDIGDHCKFCNFIEYASNEFVAGNVQWPL